MNSPDDLTPQAMQEVNNLNTELVHSLKAKDVAFSLGRKNIMVELCYF